jgi:glucokinase
LPFKIYSLELDLSNQDDFNVIEDLISGGGLAKIYSEFANIDKSPEEIVASYHTDEFSQKSIDIFLKSLAQILSEFALAYMPGKGYLSCWGFNALLE